MATLNIYLAHKGDVNSAIICNYHLSIDGIMGNQIDKEIKNGR